jgi:hypothetical protein
MAEEYTLDDLLKQDSAGGGGESYTLDDLLSLDAKPNQTPQQGAGVTESALPFDFSLMQTAKNFPRSAAGVLSDTAEAIANPAQTGRGIIELVGGLVAAALPGISPSEGLADPVIEQYAKLFESKEAFLKEFQNDPARVMSDIALLASGVGVGLKAGGLSRAAGVASTTGVVLDPVAWALKTTENVGKITQSVAADFYRRAAKLTALGLEEGDKATKALIKEGIPLTRKGAEKLNTIITIEGQRLGRLLSKADEAGEGVPTSIILQSMDRVIDEFDSWGGNSSANLEELKNMRKRLAKDWAKKPTIKPTELQKAKRNVDRDISNFDVFDSQGRATGGGAARKAGLKAQRDVMKSLLEDIDASVGPINERLSPLLGARDAFSQRVAVTGNRNLFGLSSSIMGGGLVGGGVAASGVDAFGAIPAALATAGLLETFRAPSNVTRAAIKADRAGGAMRAVGEVANNPFALAVIQAINANERAR